MWISSANDVEIQAGNSWEIFIINYSSSSELFFSTAPGYNFAMFIIETYLPFLSNKNKHSLTATQLGR